MGTLRVKFTQEWPASFIQLISQAIEHRSLPFLVDMGGRPKASQECLLQGCTHRIVLLREDLPDDTKRWQQIVGTHHLLPIARFWSRPTGPSLRTASVPVLEGVLTGLERSTARAEAGAGLIFDELLARITDLFRSSDLQEWKKRHLEHDPTELAIDIGQERRALTPELL